MKRLTNLTLFTLTVSILTLIALHGASKMRISMNALAIETAKTYLLTKQPKIIQEGCETFPTVEYVSDAELDQEIAK